MHLRCIPLVSWMHTASDYFNVSLWIAAIRQCTQRSNQRFHDRRYSNITTERTEAGYRSAVTLRANKRMREHAECRKGLESIFVRADPSPAIWLSNFLHRGKMYSPPGRQCRSSTFEGLAVRCSKPSRVRQADIKMITMAVTVACTGLIRGGKSPRCFQGWSHIFGHPRSSSHRRVSTDFPSAKSALSRDTWT